VQQRSAQDVTHMSYRSFDAQGCRKPGFARPIKSNGVRRSPRDWMHTTSPEHKAEPTFV